MSDRPTQIENLSGEEKRALLRELLVKKSAQPLSLAQSALASAGSLLQPVARNGELPLSSAQERLWFLDRFQPGCPVYNIPSAVRLTGPIDTGIVRQSFQEVVRRHEVLRTTFPSADGRPILNIAPSLTLDLPVVDLCALPVPDREAKVQRLATEEARRPFDLAQGPLVRTTLLRLAPEEHVALFTMHHIVSDAWSMGLFVREVVTCYQALAAGQPVPLSELPAQYADFAVWQRQWLGGPKYKTQLAYWKRQLQGAPAVLELPNDRPRPPLRAHRGARKLHTLSAELSVALKALSRQEGFTLFMIMLAAFKALLARYSGQDDILVGTPIANRSRTEVEGLIGVFVNTVVMRTDLSGNPTFRELLDRVRQVALGAYAHQDLPFEKLVDELHPDRGLNRTPLFQVLLVFPPVRIPLVLERIVSFLPVHSGTAKFDLVLSVVDATGPLDLYLEYDTDLFDGATATRLLGQFVTLLEGIVADADQRISELPLLTEAERHQLLVEWNDTEVDYPRDKCVHELFEQQVKRTPLSLAAVFQDRQITYEDLNRRANQLANRLIESGVAPQSLIGICIEPSLEMLVAVMAVLKAGCTYVPVDSIFPPERIAFILRDADIQLLLTQEHITDRLSELDVRCFCLDSDPEVIENKKAEDLPIRTPADAPIYVIYTSGSTGQPKGVVVTHRSVCNYLFWVRDRLLAECVDVVLLTTNLTFDAVLKQLFEPLLSGRTVRIVAQDHRYQPDRLLRQLCAQPKTAFNGVPTIWQAILEVVESSETDVSLENLTHVFLGGESLIQSLAQRTFAALPHVQIWNLYGPTETTANSTATRLNPNDPISIGRPLANTQVYVLDAQRQPAPIGVPGELYIGGAGLARGYLNRPELTAEKFVDNPFSDDPDLRLYRTGDLCRWRADGNLEFVGRLDSQVKIRGCRIEPAEVEAALLQHAAVRETVVVAGKDQRGDQQLVAYSVARAGQSLSSGQLRRFLQDRLPGYMVPAGFVSLDGLPRTSHGKIDRNALPPLPHTRLDLAPTYVAPRTETEKAVAAVWGDVLRLEKVGIRDNFFDAGGHSLLILRVQDQLAQRLGVQVPVVELFRQPTVETLARSLDEAKRAGIGQSRDRRERDREMTAGKNTLRHLLDKSKGR